jgi:peptidoglycan/LPS O-acetylase OafA/YrhL
VALKRISQLDGIRGLAIAAVLVDHLGQILNIGIGRNLVVIALYRVMHVGWLGVDIFFVLSGFLITGIILKDREQPDFWGTFYLRRAFRILPAFIVVFAVTLFAAHLFAPNIHVSASYLLPAIFFMANWTVLNNGEMPLLTHLWSLAVEEQFYFLWPQAAKRMRPENLFKLALALAVVSEFARIALALLHVDPYIVYKITPTRIDGLAIGAALAVGINLPRIHGFLTRRWRPIALVAAVMLPISFIVMRGNLFVFYVWSQVLAIPPAIILTAMLIFAAMESSLPSNLSLFFGNPVMKYLGRRSYALYLIHEPIQVAMERSRAHGYLARLSPGVAINIVLIVCALAVSFVLTELSWRLIESPAQAARHLLARGRTQRKEVTVKS